MPTLDYGRPKKRDVRLIVFVTAFAFVISGIVALSAFVRYVEMKPWPTRPVPYPPQPASPTTTPATTAPGAI
jgi:hypothetical protein